MITIIKLPVLEIEENRRPTLTSLRSILHYDEISGKCELEYCVPHCKIYKKSRINRYTSYYAIQINVGKYTRLSWGLHVLIWFMQTGIWPKEEIDHRDLNGLNNAWINLREANSSQNNANRGKLITNTSGFKGVSWSKWANKYKAYIRINNKRKHLGYFKDLIKAAQAYDSAALQYFGEFARLNFPREDYA